MCFYLDSCNLRNPIPAVFLHSLTYQVLQHAVAMQSLLDFGVPVECRRVREVRAPRRLDLVKGLENEARRLCQPISTQILLTTTGVLG